MEWAGGAGSKYETSALRAATGMYTPSRATRFLSVCLRTSGALGLQAAGAPSATKKLVDKNTPHGLSY